MSLLLISPEAIYIYLLHWPVNTDNERKLINCHLSELSANYCLHLPPHQPLCSKENSGVFNITACSESQCIYSFSYECPHNISGV